MLGGGMQCHYRILGCTELSNRKIPQWEKKRIRSGGDEIAIEYLSRSFIYFIFFAVNPDLLRRKRMTYRTDASEKDNFGYGSMSVRKQRIICVGNIKFYVRQKKTRMKQAVSKNLCEKHALYVRAKALIDIKAYSSLWNKYNDTLLETVSQSTSIPCI